ncbi:hypothetical protein [Variovorax sp.]|uniref:hypothetical protein n=1 Tax=Variovorax sp. TaxID=1871043 RepID=UPI00137F082E|nr:hypothetical protein [Variovorax sp.]KAF1060828.1 MAG: hypothetical protein GAK39_06110 [Variovorax sp.]
MPKYEKSFDYKNYHVEVDTFSVGKKVAWQYRIDGGQPHPMGDSAAASEERAVMEAWFDARARIDHMPAKQDP